MNYYLALIPLCLLACRNGSASKADVPAKADTVAKPFPTMDSLRSNAVSVTNLTSDDTVADFIKQNLYDCSLLNLSFCQKDLVRLLYKNDSLKMTWKRKIKHLFTMYDDPVDNISTKGEIRFFKYRLKQQSTLQVEDPEICNFLSKSLSAIVDTLVPVETYQKVLLRFKNADGGNFAELSGVYYSFLITDGLKFINAIKGNPQCVVLFKKWLDNIESTEFVANGGDNVPPPIIERKRNYIIEKYSSVSDPLMIMAVSKIKVAKISIID